MEEKKERKGHKKEQLHDRVIKLAVSKKGCRPGGRSFGTGRDDTKKGYPENPQTAQEMESYQEWLNRHPRPLVPKRAGGQVVARADEPMPGKEDEKETPLKFEGRTMPTSCPKETALMEGERKGITEGNKKQKKDE